MKIFLISIIALVLTVPWFFIDFSNTTVLGFPLWAFYSIVMSVLYAAVIAIMLGRYWDVSAGTDQDEKEL